MHRSCADLYTFHLQSIAKFHDEEEVIQKANNTEYGLSAAIFTKDLVRAHRVADRLESGQVTINAWGMLAANLPFGGMFILSLRSSAFFLRVSSAGDCADVSKNRTQTEWFWQRWRVGGFGRLDYGKGS